MTVDAKMPRILTNAEFNRLESENAALRDELAKMRAAHPEASCSAALPRLRAENAALKKMIGEWAEEIVNSQNGVGPYTFDYRILMSIAAKMRGVMK